MTTRYFRYSEDTIDQVAAALAWFEADTRFRAFKAFHLEQAIAFKKHLNKKIHQRGGKPLSKATLNGTLSHLKRFFRWLAGQSGYKSSLSYSDAEYFNLSRKDMRVATARREKPYGTLEQLRHVLFTMSNGSDVERRNRALVAFLLLTGARDGAVASMKLKHVDLVRGCIHQDAREVKTKASKTFDTFFHPFVGDDVQQVVEGNRVRG